MALFSIWESETCGVTLHRGTETPMLGGEPEDPAAIKVAEFDAASWNEACQKRNDHYGWGPYVPPEPPGWEPIPAGEP